MIGWKDDAIRLYDVILYGMESQEGDSFVGGMIWKLMQESVFENINAWLIGTAAVTLVGSVLVTLLNGKKTYVLAIVLSIVTNGGLAWSMQRLSWGWKNKVDYNGQMTGMPLRMEFVWVWIALHVLILIFALWGMVSKEKSASKKSISRKIEPEKTNQKKRNRKKSSRKKPYQRTRQLRRCGQRVPPAEEFRKKEKSFVRAADQNCNKRSRK